MNFPSSARLGCRRKAPNRLSPPKPHKSIYDENLFRALFASTLSLLQFRWLSQAITRTRAYASKELGDNHASENTSPKCGVCSSVGDWIRELEARGAEVYGQLGEKRRK